MRHGRDFFRPNVKDLIQKQYSVTPKRDEEGRIHVALYSELFLKCTGATLITNSLYAAFYDDIASSVETVSAGEQIVMDIFEPSESDEFSREVTILGFRRYINALYLGTNKEHWRHVILFSASLVAGAVLSFFLYNFWISHISRWLYTMIDIFSTVLVWEFAGYMAFELSHEIKQLRRLRQIRNMEFQFRLWN